MPDRFLLKHFAVGLTNLRAEFATLHKWAFDAGAGLILPKIGIRNNNTLNGFDSTWRVGSDNLFDVEALMRRLALYCPQLRLSDGSGLMDGVARVWEPPLKSNGLVYSRGRYRQYVDERLSRHNISWSSGANVIVLESTTPLIDWDPRDDPVDFNTAWFDLLQWAPRLTALSRALGGSSQLHGGYIGVHLRVERA